MVVQAHRMCSTVKTHLQCSHVGVGFLLQENHVMSMPNRSRFIAVCSLEENEWRDGYVS